MYRHFRSVFTAIVLSAATLVTFGDGASAQAGDLDCDDFATQAEAQQHLENNPSDPDGLDSEGDGRPCESLPCPCGSRPTPPPGDGGPGNGPRPEPVKRNVGVVVKVTDGDTLKVRIRGVGVREVRLLGIDTPEQYGRRECGAEEATDSMRELAPVGSNVVLLSDPSQVDRDRSGRLLRYVERRGRDVGRAQVFTGYSQVDVADSDPVRRIGNYRVAEKQAKKRDAGLWATCW